jgi:DNA-binding response OmpR family regulator
VTRARTRPTILIVDDDRYVLDLVSRVLRPLGATLLPATDAEAARNAARSERLALAVVDIGLREGGHFGYALAAELRAIQAETGHELPVIALTGQVPDVAAATQAGITTTVMKPFGLVEFRALVAGQLAEAAAGHDA